MKPGRHSLDSLPGQFPGSYLHRLLKEPGTTTEEDPSRHADLLDLGVLTINRDKYEGQKSRRGAQGLGVLSKRHGGTYLGQVIWVSWMYTI